MAKNVGNPGWLKWMVFIFIGYAIYAHFTGKTHPRTDIGSSDSLQTRAAKQADTTPDIFDPNIKITGEIAGIGDTAKCGQTADVTVSGIWPDGSAYEEVSADTPVSVKVGTLNSTMPWVAGVTGMQKGGVREIQVPANYFMSEDAMREKGLKATDVIRFKIQMQDVSPLADPTHMPFRASDTNSGLGDLVYCGNHVEIKLVVWNTDGSKLYDSDIDAPGVRTVVQVGNNDLFYGLDRGLLGMRVGGTRHLVIPPDYIVANQAVQPHPLFAQLPKDKIVVADVTLVAIEETQLP